MKEEMKTVYTTSDGKTFTDKEAAEQNERFLTNFRTFKVRFSPDLNQTGRLGKEGHVHVHAKAHHKEMCEAFCYKKFGPRIDFVQGGKDSNALVVCWTIQEVPFTGVLDAPVIGIIEDRYIEKMFRRSDL